MMFVFMLLCAVVVAMAAGAEVAVGKDFDCNAFNNNCLSCIQATKNVAHQCTYCPVDQICHTVGSLFNKCSNDECVSLCATSSCEKDTADGCNAVSEKKRYLRL